MTHTPKRRITKTLTGRDGQNNSFIPEARQQRERMALALRIAGRTQEFKSLGSQSDRSITQTLQRSVPPSIIEQNLWAVGKEGNESGT